MMKAKRFVLVVIVIILSVCILAPAQSRAANEDFEVSYLFSPSEVGFLGGDITLRLDVTNAGATDITWVKVVINNEAAFNEHLEATITPGGFRQFWLTVPFAPSDLDKDLFLQVSMNNNVSANPDGIKMFTFEIERADQVAGVQARVSPERSVYRVGDRVTITHTFSAEMGDYYLVDARYQLSLDITDSGRIYDSGMINHGDITPTEDAVHSFSYTFRNADIGEVAVVHSLQFDMLGRTYNTVSPSMFLTVEEALPPEVAFTAELTAEPTLIESGDMVTFAVAIENTGEDTIDTIEVTHPDGEPVTTFESVSPGMMTQAVTTSYFDEAADVYFVVTGSTDEVSETVETNTVRIEIDPREETPAPTEEEAQTADPSPTAQPSAVAEDSEEPGDPPQRNNTVLYIVIGVLAFLIAAVAVVVFILVRKRKRAQGKEKRA